MGDAGRHDDALVRPHEKGRAAAPGLGMPKSSADSHGPCPLQAHPMDRRAGEQVASLLKHLRDVVEIRALFLSTPAALQALA